MIRSFRSKALKRFAEKGDASKLPVKQTDRVRRLVAFLDAAKHARDLGKPGLFLHSLRSQGRDSVRVTGNYRLTCRFEEPDAFDVDLEDYH